MVKTNTVNSRFTKIGKTENSEVTSIRQQPLRAELFKFPLLTAESGRGAQHATPLCHHMPFRMDCFFTVHVASLSPDLTGQIMGISSLNSQFYLREPFYVRTQMGCYSPENLLPVSQDNKLNIKQTIQLCFTVSPHPYRPLMPTHPPHFCS